MTRGELLAREEAFERALDRSRGIDRYCSGLAWSLSAHDALYGERDLLAWESDAGFALLARKRIDQLGEVIEPLEASWIFGSSLVGPRPADLVGELVDELGRRAPEAGLLIVGGLQADRELVRQVRRQLCHRWTLARVLARQRRSASLAGGLAGYLGRRSRKFRENLRRQLRRAGRRHLSFDMVIPSSPAAARGALARALEVEARSWKARAGGGITTRSMRRFYELQCERLAIAGRLRFLFALLDGRCVGYLFGGVRAGSFRGLQLSFDDDLRPLGVGNLLQYEMIRYLCEAGFESYDLGQPVPYKERWAEGGLETVTLVALPRR